MTSVAVRERPYFIWDYDISDSEFRAMLTGDNEYETAWAIARLLEAARWSDIWKYITLSQVRAWFPRLQLRREVRSVWEYAFSIWDQPDDTGQHSHPIAA
jgi:hypothetical protein